MTDLQIPDFMGAINDRVEDALNAASNGVVLRWGTVTQADPLRVKLDADADALPFKPATAPSGLRVGDRVRCSVQNLRVTVESVAGRGPATQAEATAGLDDSHYLTPRTLRDMPLYEDFAATLGAGWSWYAGHDRYLRKQPNGFVHLRGTLYTGTGASFDNILTVPATCIPVADSTLGGVVRGSSGYHGVGYLRGAPAPTPGRFQAAYGTGTNGVGAYVVIDMAWWAPR